MLSKVLTLTFLSALFTLCHASTVPIITFEDIPDDIKSLLVLELVSIQGGSQRLAGQLGTVSKHFNQKFDYKALLENPHFLTWYLSQDGRFGAFQNEEEEGEYLVKLMLRPVNNGLRRAFFRKLLLHTDRAVNILLQRNSLNSAASSGVYIKLMLDFMKTYFGYFWQSAGKAADISVPKPPSSSAVLSENCIKEMVDYIVETKSLPLLVTGLVEASKNGACPIAVKYLCEKHFEHILQKISEATPTILDYAKLLCLGGRQDLLSSIKDKLPVDLFIAAYFDDESNPNRSFILGLFTGQPIYGMFMNAAGRNVYAKVLRVSNMNYEYTPQIERFFYHNQKKLLSLCLQAIDAGETSHPILRNVTEELIQHLENMYKDKLVSDEDVVKLFSIVEVRYAFNGYAHDNHGSINPDFNRCGQKAFMKYWKVCTN